MDAREMIFGPDLPKAMEAVMHPTTKNSMKLVATEFERLAALPENAPYKHAYLLSARHCRQLSE